jgi:hypothetical protein
MRRFAIGTMLILGLAAGCEKPIEGIPSPAGSTVSSGDDLAVEMPTEGQPASGTTAPATPPATENSAPPTDPAKPTPDAPALPGETVPPPVGDAPSDLPKQSSVSTASGVKFVADTSLKVPTMTCPHGCWPSVKETLVAQPGVEAVELAKQSSDDSIDNPVVYIKLNGKFDSKAAVDALAKAGFDKAEVAN